MKLRVAAWLALAGVVSWFAAASAGQQAPKVDFAGQQNAAIRYLKASNPGEDDRIGIGDPLVGVTMAMSADGNTLAVSAPHEDGGATGVNGNQQDDSAWDSGAVYVFVRTGSNWTQQAYIKPSNTQASDKFGFAIALSGDGNTLAVGATLEDSSARGGQADNSAESAGAAYVFVRNGSRWSQQAYLKASNADAGDQFGWSVALSRDGNTLAVGAQSEASAATGVNANQADNSAGDAGAAYVFVRSGTTWSQQAYLKASNAQGADRFGFCVSLTGDGNTLGVCGYDEDGGAKGVNGPKNEETPGSGAVYVFSRRGSDWTEDAYVKPSNTFRNQAFGSAIALSADGSTLAVGSPDETSLSRGVDSDQTQTVNNQISPGAVYVFGRTAGGWSQQAYIKPFNTGTVDLFGVRIALNQDGSVLAVGAPGQGGGGRGINPPNHLDKSAPESGAAFVFLRGAGKWSQHAYLKAPNSEEYDQFGGAVALSGNGTVLAVAASGEDGGSKGVDGDQNDNSVRDSGAIFVF